MALPEHLSGLLDPGAYPHPCPAIELIETHISWVVLTGVYAYKLKKPVCFNFVDFSSLALREHYCREEVRCNRAFAPDLYLGVVAVRMDGAGLRIGAEDGGGVLEWAVQMRQFDPELALDRMLERGELTAGALRGFGGDLAARHAGLPVLDASPREVRRRIVAPVEDSFEEIAGTGLGGEQRALFEEALAASRSLADALLPLFEARISAGALRECHGDLHLSNLALVDGEITAFDCLEFNDNLRWIDTMSDVAFLFMDCHVRGEIALAYAFLDGYLDGSGDYPGLALLGYFCVYRSVVRAKVAALRWVQAGEAEAAGRCLTHLAWARDWMARPPGRLLITCGLSGSGKSHLAGRLVEHLPALRLRSDVARKALAGLEALAASSSPVDGGLYTPEQSERTFAHLAEVAAGALRAGEHVIVDATFIERTRRDQFLELAERLGITACILYCDAPESVLRERVARRTGSGTDPSEATGAVLDLQLARFEPPAAEEPVIRVDTSTPISDEAIAGLVRGIRARWARPG